MSTSYTEIQNLGALADAMRDAGATRLFFKVLVKNNNDKQQIYIATDMAKVNFLPTGDTEAARSRSSKKNSRGTAIFRADMPLSWLNSDGCLAPAPGTKLIFYPQYPEVRISGFLDNCELAPTELLSIKDRGKEPGRVLFLGVTQAGTVVVTFDNSYSRLRSKTVKYTLEMTSIDGNE